MFEGLVFEFWSHIFPVPEVALPQSPLGPPVFNIPSPLVRRWLPLPEFCVCASCCILPFTQPHAHSCVQRIVQTLVTFLCVHLVGLSCPAINPSTPVSVWLSGTRFSHQLPRRKAGNLGGGGASPDQLKGLESRTEASRKELRLWIPASAFV